MSIYTHMYISLKTRSKETKRLLLKCLPFLHKNPCFHKCEGHLFYKTFSLDTTPSVPIVSIREQWYLSETGFQWLCLAFGEIMKLGIPNFVCKWNSWPCFTCREKRVCFPWRPAYMTTFSTPRTSENPGTMIKGLSKTPFTPVFKYH